MGESLLGDLFSKFSSTLLLRGRKRELGWCSYRGAGFHCISFFFYFISVYLYFIVNGQIVRSPCFFKKNKKNENLVLCGLIFHISIITTIVIYITSIISTVSIVVCVSLDDRQRNNGFNSQSATTFIIIFVYLLFC